MAIEVDGQKLKLKRELEAGWFKHIECPLPAVLTIQSGINKVRYATLKGIMAAKKKEITTIARESLGVSVEPTQRVERIYVPTKTKKTEFLTGTPKEVASKLVEKLKFEGWGICHEVPGHRGNAAGKMEQHELTYACICGATCH